MILFGVCFIGWAFVVACLFGLVYVLFERKPH